MIDYPRSESPSHDPLRIRFIGLGNAGVHLADRLTMANPGIEVVAMNTDVQSLTQSVAPQKVVLGQKVTRGLGTGGDPEVGYEAAQESVDEVRAAVEGAQIVFLAAGLGGGTASGGIGLLAGHAREAGATVFAIVTSPFSFEGRRRSTQAAEAVTALAGQCHAVIHFENDRMSEISSPRAGIEETFETSDSLLISCVNALVDILKGGGPMPVSMADLLAAIGGGSAQALFGRGEASGENRAHEALERALRSPLLDRGRLLEEGHAVIAHISGPSSLSFAEVAAIMRELDRHIADNARLFLGVTASADSSAPFFVTVIGNYSAHTATETVAAPVPAPQATLAPVRKTPEPVEKKPAPVKPEEDERPLFETPQPTPAPEEKPPAPPPVQVREPRPAPVKPAAPPSRVKQETLQFETVARGRFEKSEPTIVEGEDLDVPTFLRMRGKPADDR